MVLQYRDGTKIKLTSKGRKMWALLCRYNVYLEMTQWTDQIYEFMHKYGAACVEFENMSADELLEHGYAKWVERLEIVENE